MTYAVRVPEEFVCIVGRHVGEGQAVIPGLPLMDIMTPDGMVETIFSEGWGIVAHVEGNRVRKSNTDDGEEGGDPSESGFMFTGGTRGGVFMQGETICHIVAREQHGTRKAGLHPRPAPSVRFRRLMGVSR